MIKEIEKVEGIKEVIEAYDTKEGKLYIINVLVGLKEISKALAGYLILHYNLL